MRRDALFLREMISAGARVVELVDGVDLEDLRNDKGTRGAPVELHRPG
jgi:uncharacterized protein with HEPN domain